MHSHKIRFNAIAKYKKFTFVGLLLKFKTFTRKKNEEIIQTQEDVDEVFNCRPWKGKTCFAVQCFGLVYSNSLSIFRIFLIIYFFSPEFFTFSPQLFFFFARPPLFFASLYVLISDIAGAFRHLDFDEQCRDSVT